MSRWDPEPTPLQRWMVRHRTGVSVGAVLLLVSAIGLIVSELVTDGFVMALIVPMCAIATSLSSLFTIRGLSRYVEKYDSAQHQGPTSG